MGFLEFGEEFVCLLVGFAVEVSLDAFVEDADKFEVGLHVEVVWLEQPEGLVALQAPIHFSYLFNYFYHFFPQIL